MQLHRDVERALQAWRAAERARDSAVSVVDRAEAEEDARRRKALYLQLVDQVAVAAREPEGDIQRADQPA
jgi:hypothetical protein